ncbi:MAG TPA: hypothetical protein VIF40_18280 [Methylosinus sp.]|uniref:hypothetical protein n=1 Tax=Methylosinus sp. TaxID=427 RepID=UPI002F94E567
MPVSPMGFGEQVPMRPLRAGDGAKASLAAERADHAEANRRLSADRDFYTDVRARFGAKD